MHYLLLSLAVALISAQVCFVKIYQLRAGTGIRVCLVFVLLTGAVSALVFACANGFHIAVSAFSLLLALPLALCVSFNNALGIRMLGRGDLATYTRFIMLGNMLLPFAYGALVLHESVGILRLAALGILVFSLFLPFLGSENARKRKGFDLVLYFLAFFAYGFVGVISKAHQIDARGVDAGSFLFFTFLFSALGAAVLLLLLRKGAAKPLPPTRFPRKTAMFAASVGFSAVSGLAFWCELAGAEKVSASLQYPLVTGGTILFSALLGSLLFHEKQGARGWVEIGLAFEATLLFLF